MHKPELHLSQTNAQLKSFNMRIHDRKEPAIFYENFVASSPEKAIKAAQSIYKGCEIKINGVRS